MYFNFKKFLEGQQQKKTRWETGQKSWTANSQKNIKMPSHADFQSHSWGSKNPWVCTDTNEWEGTPFPYRKP